MSVTPTPTPAPTSAWQHASLVLGSAFAIVIGAGDAYLKQKLGAGIDIALIVAGFAGLGIKGITGSPS